MLRFSKLCTKKYFYCKIRQGLTGQKKKNKTRTLDLMKNSKSERRVIVFWDSKCLIVASIKRKVPNRDTCINYNSYNNGTLSAPSHENLAIHCRAPYYSQKIILLLMAQQSGENQPSTNLPLLYFLQWMKCIGPHEMTRKIKKSVIKEKLVLIKGTNLTKYSLCRAYVCNKRCKPLKEL